MQKLQTMFALGGLLMFGTSCGTKTVLVHDSSDIVRIGPGGATGRVFVWQGGAWTLSGKVKLPEGWYAGPGPIPP